jgi:tetratricopeptide (TPR) repeat protein
MAPRPPRFIRAVLTTLLGVCLGAGHPDSNSNPNSNPDPNPNRTNPNRNPNRMTEGAAERVAMVAVDGADWRVIDELVAAGRLPAFARISKGGACGTLKGDPPLLAPIAWTTVATGRPPQDHGVLDSMVDVGGGSQVPVHGGARRAKAAWEIWSEASRSVLVVGWPVTWPVDRVRGVVVSDRLAAGGGAAGDPDGPFLQPPEALEWVSKRLVTPSAVAADLLSRFVPAGASGHGTEPRLRAALAGAQGWRGVLAGGLQDGQPDLVVVHIELVDAVSHLFVRDRSNGEAAIAAAYEEADGMLADLAGRLHPATLVVVLSAYGFYPPDAGIREDPAAPLPAAAAWHRPYGIFATASAGVVAGRTEPPSASALGLVSPLDVLPTVLTRAGLPVAADMPGRPLPGLAGPATQARVPSYGPHVPPEGTRPRADPTALARVHLAEILCRRGDYRGGLRELDAALRQDALDGQVLLWMARCHAAMGRADEAQRLYERLLAAKGASVEVRATALLEATTLDLRSGRVSAALERVDRAPPVLDRAPEALIARGDASEAEGRRPAAERLYRAALDAAPSDATAARRLVDLLVADGHADTGRTLAARLAQSYPSSPPHLALAGRASLAIKRHAEAARWFELALVRAPDDPELLALLDAARKR